MLSDVKGQDEAVLFLRRVVEGKFSDPILLVGEEGVGRRYSAIQTIKEVACQLDREPNCPCGSCLQIEKDCHPDLLLIAPPSDKSIGVDTIREMLDLAWESPKLSRLRFMVIDGADRLTNEAANALLKTLEEPPPATRFILITESYHRVMPTIRSRCGKISYRPLPDGLVLSVLSRFEKDPGKASIYTRMGEGSVGRSLSYMGAGRLALRDRVLGILQLALAKDIPRLFSSIDDLKDELPVALRFVEHALHDIFMVTTDPTRMINLDQRETMQRIRDGAKLALWVKFGDGVRGIRERYRRTRINLSFHVKALFADTFTV
jgi:DNA polymerase-3 subunit delta'